MAGTVICGEAERIWPRFCADFEARSAQALYRDTGTIDMRTSAAARFDLPKLPLYTAATLQLSRGRPYLCEFCEIIVMFGRKPRQRSLEQIARELDILRQHGVRKIFFVDDNLIGDLKVAKSLLRFLIDYQTRHRYSFSFGTGASLNPAQDDELMALFREAHFRWAFIGIESPEEASLRETRKLRNVREHPLAAVPRIHAHGIEVWARFIIGFDNDTVATFERQSRAHDGPDGVSAVGRGCIGRGGRLFPHFHSRSQRALPRVPGARGARELRKRAAARTLLLVDFELRNLDWWTAVCKFPEKQSRGTAWREPFPRRSAIPLTRATLMLAWQAIRTAGEKARIVLGMAGKVAEIIRDLQLTQLDRIADRRHRHLEPRWADRTAVWRSLLEAASAPDPAAT